MPRDARELRGAWASFQTIRYADPPPDLAGVVDHYWGVEWDLRGQPPYAQKVVPYPSVHLTLRDGEALVTGPARRRQAWHGTDRQARGALLAVLRATAAPVSGTDLRHAWAAEQQRMRCLDSLVADGLVEPLAGDRFRLPAS